MAANQEVIGFDEPAMKTIGLCMIVKDEATVIERCLDSVRPLVDYVLIEDTGSTDGTQEIIRAYLRRHGIPGEVTEEKWRDFAYNRSHVMARLRETVSVDYALIMDADDRIVIDAGFDPVSFKAGLRADCYHVWIQLGSTLYSRPQIYNNRLDFYFRGVIHEFLEGPPGGHSSATAEGFHIAAGVEGARSNDPDKYRKDAQALERALAQETDAFMRTRYTFYMAQSWRDCGEAAKSVVAYLDRAAQGGWVEEVFVSLYNAGKLQATLGAPIETAVATLQRATDLVPARAEALHAASRACRLASRYQLGYELAERGVGIPEPSGGLFIEQWIYQYGLLDELSVCAYWSGHYTESLTACERLLRDGKMPPEMVERVTRNRDFARERLDEESAPAPHAGPAAAARLPAVFIHSSWRTASTWFLTKFRACPEAMAFFEPFNPLLATGTAEQLKEWDFTYWDSHHPADDPYCLEYLPLLRKTGGVRRFRAEMEYEWYIPQGGLRGELRPQERSYLTLLVQQAQAAGRIPVLGCTRSLARMGAIKKAFGDFHIFLYRNLWHQWQSFIRYERQNIPFFYQTSALILDSNREDPFLNYLADFYLSRAPSAGGEASNRDRLLALAEADTFAMFAALHIYLYLHAGSVADLTVDVTRMGGDAGYRQSIERELGARTGLNISLADVAAGEDTANPGDIAVNEVRWDEIASHIAYAARILGDLAPSGVLRDRAAALLAETRAAAERYARLIDAAPRTPTDAASNPAAALYLDLMERCLLNTLYGDRSSLAPASIGEARLGSFRRAIEQAVKDAVPGDIVEIGAGRGVASIMARAVLRAYGVDDRTVWVAGSFEGQPHQTPETHPAVSLEEVQADFDRYGLLDGQVRFLTGPLSQAPIDKLAVLRLDGDLYPPTIAAMTALYDKVQPGGFVIVDDYGVADGCRPAIADFRRERDIGDPILDIDGIGAYWRKPFERPSR